MLVIIIEKEVFCQTFVHKSLSSPEWNSGRLPQKAKAFSSGVFSGVWSSFTREKRFKSRWFQHTILINYPVDDLWQLKLVLSYVTHHCEQAHLPCATHWRAAASKQHTASSVLYILLLCWGSSPQTLANFCFAPSKLFSQTTRLCAVGEKRAGSACRVPRAEIKSFIKFKRETVSSFKLAP